MLKFFKFQFNPRSPEFRANPYPFYERLRAEAPIFYWADRDMWLISQYADCKTLLRDNRLGHHATPGNSMLFQNPPDHTRLRGLVNKAFTPRMVERWRDTAQALTDQLLDKVQAQGHMDIIADLAYPLPLVIIAEMMGVPPEDHVKFQNWSEIVTRDLDIDQDPVVGEQSSLAIQAFEAYFAELIAQRRQEPSDDLLTDLVEAEEAGDKLRETELHTTARLLLIAGHETTVNLIGNAVLTLLQHPEQKQKLQQDPKLIQTAIEEVLRYESPIQFVSRRPLEPVHYKGHCLSSGQEVLFLLAGANRDPAQFVEPNTFDITRQKNAHLAFSHGIHYCVGAPLARLESQIAINTLLHRFSNLALATDNLIYRDNFLFHGLEILPVSF